MADIKGMFRVNKNNPFTLNIQYAVCIMKDRLLFIKVGGEFADGGKAVAGAAIGGVIGAVIGASMDQKGAKIDSQKEAILQRLRGMSDENLLSLDKANYEVSFDLISRITMKESTYNLAYMKPRCGTLKLETSGKSVQKFDISAKDSFLDCRNILSESLPQGLVSRDNVT